MASKKGSHDPCKKESCDIQRCLNEHNFDDQRCLDTIEMMLKCCRVWREKSICCSGFMLHIQQEEKDASVGAQKTHTHKWQDSDNTSHNGQIN